MLGNTKQHFCTMLVILNSRITKKRRHKNGKTVAVNRLPKGNLFTLWELCFVVSAEKILTAHWETRIFHHSEYIQEQLWKPGNIYFRGYKWIWGKEGNFQVENAHIMRINHTFSLPSYSWCTPELRQVRIGEGDGSIQSKHLFQLYTEFSAKNQGYGETFQPWDM